MGNLFSILIALFISLALIVFILQRWGRPMASEQQVKLSRWVLPLLVILLLLQLLRNYF